MERSTLRLPWLSSPFPFIPIGLLAFCVYVPLIRYFRYRNLHSINEKYRKYLDKPYSMDYVSAHEIIRTMILREFPFTLRLSLQFGLTKSYSMPELTKVLAQTRRITNEQKVGKRSEDTVVFWEEFLVEGIDSERGRTALAKMNWIHRQYGSKIGKNEMLYTLALFMFEPKRRIDLYEWRELSDLEQLALFIYWREIGNRMGMSDIPETMEDYKHWVEEYEAKTMRYAESNRQCATMTLGLFTRPLPSLLRGVGDQVISSLIEAHVRPFLGLEEPLWVIQVGVQGFFNVRALIMRYLSPPRFWDADMAGTENESGKIQRHSYMFEPWYVSKSLWGSVMELVFPKDRDFIDHGFLPGNIGSHGNHGRETVLAEAEKMHEYALQGGSAGTGCPFSFRG